MASDARARLKEWLSSGQAKLHPLTLQQREMWETSPVAPGDPANHICSYFEIQGPVTFEHTKAAVARLVERHEALRTSFLPGKERPLQIVRASAESIEPAVRYRKLEEGDDLEAIMEESFREPFDFVRGPLYRLDMFERGEDDFVSAFTIHHSVGDGWTLGAFVEDLCSAYILELQDSGELDLGKVGNLRQSLPDLAMTHTTWGAVERAKWTPAEIGKHAEFWKRRLEGSQKVFAVETDRTGLLDKWVTELPADLSASVRALSKRTGATLFNTLLASFQIALRRWKGVSDITVGTPVANRREAAVKETMGYFAGIVPLRGKVDEGFRLLTTCAWCRSRRWMLSRMPSRSRSWRRCSVRPRRRSTTRFLIPALRCRIIRCRTLSCLGSPRVCGRFRLARCASIWPAS